MDREDPHTLRPDNETSNVILKDIKDMTCDVAYGKAIQREQSQQDAKIKMLEARIVDLEEYVQRMMELEERKSRN